EKLPEGYTLPEGRTKPWGTAHAVLCAKDLVDAPFAVINADDFYGYTAFEQMYQFLKSVKETTPAPFSMVGYTLQNTLTENGHVSRGVCDVNAGYLTKVTERTHIAYHEEGVAFLEADTWHSIPNDAVVSMNLWGFTPAIFGALEQHFAHFLETEAVSNPLKSEYFLPFVVDELVKEHQATVRVLESQDRWYGVTYKEDKPTVVAAIKALQEQGLYPQKLWPSPHMPVALNFQFDGLVTEIGPTGNGHINDTYLVTTTGPKRYILQRINHNIFKNPRELMANIEGVLTHLNEKLAPLPGVDLEREILTIVPSLSGDSLYIDHKGNFWRSFLFIDQTISYDQVPNLEVFTDCGQKFGEFQALLADYDASTLFETIPHFHNTPVRFENFLKALEADAVGRAASIQDEIAFVLSRKADAYQLVDQLKKGELPLRVTHNDTKINNILVDSMTQKALCVIDLDTIMPGLSAYDFGDCIRTGASSGAEDEIDLSKIYVVNELFESFAKGYISGVGSSFNETEILSLLTGSKIMTFECGMRFLTDYLEGDHYFKIHRHEHNLDRARTQFKLVADMESKWDELTTILKNLIQKA
ncbi:MAG: phosphotransferase, partial [Cellulosilyticaceae bacterium]